MLVKMSTVSVNSENTPFFKSSGAEASVNRRAIINTV